MSNKLSDLQDSLTLAAQIEEIKAVIMVMDLDYANQMADRLIEQGNFQDSAAVLYPSNPLEKNDLLRLQGKALKKMCEFVELLKQCEEGKAKVRKAEQHQSDIMKMFM